MANINDPGTGGGDDDTSASETQPSDAAVQRAVQRAIRGEPEASGTISTEPTSDPSDATQPVRDNQSQVRDEDASGEARGATPTASDAGGDQVTSDEQRQANAAVANEVERVRDAQQGVERDGGRVGSAARGLEQQVLDSNPGLDEDDVRIQRDGDTLRAGVTPTGAQTFADRRAQFRQRQREGAIATRGAAEAVSRDPGFIASLNRAREEAIRENQAATRRAAAAVADDPGRTREALFLSQSQDAQQAANEETISSISSQQTAFQRRREAFQQEQFGDNTIFRVRELGGRSLEEIAEDSAESIRSAGAAAATRAVPKEGETTVPLVVPGVGGGLVSIPNRGPGPASALRGSIKGAVDVAAFPLDAALAAKEGGELGAQGVNEYLEGEGGEFNNRVLEEGAERLSNAEQAFKASPVELSSRLATGAVVTGGAIKGASAVGGARAGRAVSVAVQPGEELAISAARRGLIPNRAATMVPGVRDGNINADTSASQSFKVSDDNVRESLTGTVSDTVEGARERLSAVSSPERIVERTSRMTRGRGGEGDAALQQTFTRGASFPTPDIPSVSTPDVNVRGQVRRARDAVDKAIYSDTAVTRAGQADVALQQSFTRGASFPTGNTDIRTQVRGVADRIPSDEDIVRALSGTNTRNAGRADVAVQQSFTRGASFPSGSPSPGDIGAGAQAAAIRARRRLRQEGVSARFAIAERRAQLEERLSGQRGGDGDEIIVEEDRGRLFEDVEESSDDPFESLFMGPEDSGEINTESETDANAEGSQTEEVDIEAGGDGGGQRLLARGQMETRTRPESETSQRREPVQELPNRPRTEASIQLDQEPAGLGGVDIEQPSISVGEPELPNVNDGEIAQELQAEADMQLELDTEMELRGVETPSDILGEIDITGEFERSDPRLEIEQQERELARELDFGGETASELSTESGLEVKDEDEDPFGFDIKTEEDTLSTGFLSGDDLEQLFK